MSSVLGEAGPEAVARMIRLEVRTAQAVEPAAAAPAAPAQAPAIRQAAQVGLFSVLVTPSGGAIVLSQDAAWTAALEKENNLGSRLAGGAPFAAAGRQVFVASSTAYPAGRTLFQCIGIVPTA